MQSEQFGITMLALISVLLIMVLKSKLYILRALLGRGIMGVILIYSINQICLSLEFTSGIGINIWNLLTSTILGFPGVVLLYTIHFSQIL